MRWISAGKTTNDDQMTYGEVGLIASHDAGTALSVVREEVSSVIGTDGKSKNKELTNLRDNRTSKAKWSITGSAKNSKIRATQRKLHLFVSRIDPETEVRDFESMVRVNISEAVCES
ncbi:hypothetical protein WA026_022062 [Henosepilachna vigintioctopunctata]|uniref:Uncharacterized protein n=1 Tax=Henosepilachna vigintioctopunctata TaxID=420089 RepID=A0AAW1UCK5_9CUCU